MRGVLAVALVSVALSGCLDGIESCHVDIGRGNMRDDAPTIPSAAQWAAMGDIPAWIDALGAETGRTHDLSCDDQEALMQAMEDAGLVFRFREPHVGELVVERDGEPFAVLFGTVPSGEI